MRPLSPVGPGIELTGTERAAQLSGFQPLSPSESRTYCLKYSASLACWDWLALVEYVNRARGWLSCSCETAWFRALGSVSDWGPPLPPVPPMPGPEENSLLACRPGTISGAHKASTMEASPTRRPAAASARVSGPGRLSPRLSSPGLSSPRPSESAPSKVPPGVRPYRGAERHSETRRPQTRIRSRPSALSMAR